MEAIEAIMTRRSIRRYTDLPVPDGTVKDLLRAAMAAPSAKNQRPWYFVVIRDRQVMERILEFHPFADALHYAPVAIVICGDGNNPMWIQDCAAATQNMLIAARALELGAVWLGLFPEKQGYWNMQKLLDIPNYIIPLAIVALGYPAENRRPSNRFDTKRIHLDHWGNTLFQT
jgi:nitroreductase